MTASIKQLRSAVNSGVSEVCPDRPGPVQSMIDATLALDKGFEVQALLNTEDALDKAKAIGAIVASTLSSPLLQIGELRQQRNQQLVRNITRQVVRPSNAQEIVVGLGGSEQAPSLRLPIYVTPALELASKFEQEGIKPPKVRIFNGMEVSVRANGLCADLAQDSARLAKHLLEAYRIQYYPELSESVDYENIDADELDLLGVQSDSEYLRSKMAGESEITLVLNRILLNTLKHSAGSEFPEDIASYYAATHGPAFHEYGHESTTGVIKFGGAGEKAFNVVEQHMALRAHKLGTHVANYAGGGPIQVGMLTKAGTVPPYYPQSGELTVASSARQIPDCLNDIATYYAESNLSSGSDYQQLPPHIRVDYVEFLKSQTEA